MSPTLTTPSSAQAPTPTLSYRLRALGVTGRRLRRGWTRQRMMEVLRTLVYVVPLTLLVWVWAQDQQIDVRQLRSVPVRIEHIDGGKVVTVQRASSGEDVSRRGDSILATLTFHGPRIGLNAVVRALSEDPASPLLELRLRGRSTEQTTISLREELNQLDVLREEGVTIRDATPSDLIVSIEDRRQIEARIVAANVDPEDLAGPVVFEPATVVLTGPATALSRLEVAGDVTLAAHLPDSPPGEQEAQLTVTIPGAAASGIRPESIEVTARFTRRERRDDSLVLPFPVPVMANVPAALRVVPEGLTPVINGLRVRGPAHLIARLRNSDPALREQIHVIVPLLKDDELRPGEQITREARLELPTGLVLEGEAPTVSFTVRLLDAS